MNLSVYKFTITPQGLSGSAAATYSRKVHEYLRWIHRTKSGKILLDAIKFYRRPVTIVPYTGGDCNATGGGVGINGSIDGIVNYSPDTFSLHGVCPANRPTSNRGLLWDEILFHELVHVFRNVSRRWNAPALGFGLRHYTNNEEFFAVVLTNIYISDRTNKIKSGLRANHATFDPLAADFDDSFKFFSTSTMTFGLIEKFCSDNPGLTKKIANDLADTAFNPLAAYYTDKEKARKLSQAAKNQDIAGLIQGMQEFKDNLLNSLAL